MILVWLINIDSAMPNIALAKLAHWHMAQGHQVELRNRVDRDLWEPQPDIAYASSIFVKSEERRTRFKQNFPTGLISGTGVARDGGVTVESIIGIDEYEHYDYSIYPDFDASIGFTERGCRLKCGFCVVPVKEGKPRSVNRIADIWRGEPHPKHIHLLDNDFFGNPEWRERIAEIKDGGFKISLSQGINVRLINEEGAQALGTVEYRDNEFKTRRLYTAWDNLKDEKVFFRGVSILEQAGIPPTHLMAYMLIGYDKAETWDRLWHRFTLMVERGISPYPMVFDAKRKDMKCFQRWVIVQGGMYRWVPWDKYERETKSAESVEAWRPYAERLVAALPKLRTAA